MTQEENRRIRQAQQETQRIIDKEMRYSEHFRHEKFLATYRAHLDKLDAMLEEVTH